MIGLLVYLADIASGAKITAWILAVTLPFVGLFMLATAGDSRKEGDHEEAKFLRRLGTAVLLLSVLMLASGVFIPKTETVYKIVGISSQEKARIDALGNIAP